VRRLGNARLTALSAVIETVEPGTDFERRVRGIIDASVLPEIQAAADTLTTSYERAFGKLAVTAASASLGATAGVSLSLLGGLGVWGVLTAGALAAVTGSAATGSAQIPEAITDVWTAKRATDRANAFTYLTKLGST
jgi:hypothetical protein